MKLFNLLKNILQELLQKNELIDLESFKKQDGLLALRYVQDKGLEQDILAKALKSRLDNQKMSETLYGYLLWIAGELMNNVFDHAQTLGKTLKGGILAVRVKDNKIQLGVGDLGIGLKNSLEKNPKIQIKKIDAKQAIKLALSENTSGWPYKRGNGLPDVLRLVQAGQGKLKIYSDQTLWTQTNNQEKWEQAKEALPGVIVVCELEIKDFQVPRRGQPKGKVMKLAQFGKQLSGRDKGQEAYEVLIQELTSLPRDGALLIDLSGIIMMNSSFGDQALGVLLENIKQGYFGAKKIFFTGEIKEVVDVCLDRIAEIRDVAVLRV
jgi:hypothetical protein